ncbi:MAG: SDR family NAD(P)-dependent oxidoreductase [Waddliaceae bacterium]
MEKEQDRVALVTGASKGLGKSLSEELIKSGWTVVGIARSIEQLNTLKKSLGPDNFIPYICDVSVAEQVKRVSESLREKKIIPALFFLNAGIAGEAACESSSNFLVAKHREIFATNYFGVLNWIEEWLPTSLNSTGTNFIATSSINAIFAPPTGSAYAASKAAIAKAFEGLSLTYHQKNITFSVVYAGPIATDGLKGNVPFAWGPKKMAKYMIKAALKGKTHIENSVFYSILARVLHLLPNCVVMKILKSF